LSSLKQQAAAEAFARRKDLIDRVKHESRSRINRVRITVGYPRLPREDVNDFALSALGLGYYRALIRKFSTTNGLSDEWWSLKRREFADHGKDRSADLAIILSTHQEFADFHVPLTDDEVVKAAKIEFRDMIASAGTDYHQIEACRKASGRMTHPIAVGDAPDPATRELTDDTAQDAVENFALHKLMNDDNHPLGPMITRMATIAVREFGRNGLFWLVERMFLPTRYTEVTRALVGSEEEVGLKEFERVKRDMSRKLPEVHSYMVEILRDDEEMEGLLDLMWSDSTSTSRIPSIGSTINVTKPDISDERERSRERNRTKLIDRLKADDELELLDAFSGLPASATIPILADYIKCRDTAWESFKAKLACICKKVA
jgi:hypothetical protein